MTEPATLELPAAPAALPAPTPPTPDAPPAPTGPLADLVLARLLVGGGKSVAVKALTADIAGFFRKPPVLEDVAAVVDRLRTAGLVTPGRGVRLTDAGRAHALAYLGVAGLPPKSNWGTIKGKFLMAKALGLSPTSEEDAKVLGDAKTLAPLLLKRKYGLPVGTQNSVTKVIEAVACKLLGFPDRLTLKDVAADVISRELKSGPALTGGDLSTAGVQLLLNAPKGGLEGLRAVALAGWADGSAAETSAEAPAEQPTPPVQPAAADDTDFDLEAFANTVKSAARMSPTGRFGDNKVFISHVWRQLGDEPRFAPLGFDGFKRKLVEANRENLLTLARADLYQVQDPADLDASETHHHNAVFHFVVVEQE